MGLPLFDNSSGNDGYSDCTESGEDLNAEWDNIEREYNELMKEYEQTRKEVFG